jgi:GGDEF domain-containing protein
VSIAQRLDDAVRREDVVSRSGGDEFVILLRDPGDLELIMERVFAALAEPVGRRSTRMR